jgi:hypothetical protein
MPSSRFSEKTVQIVVFNVEGEEAVYKEIKTFLHPLIKNRSISIWSIRDVTAGGFAEEEIMAHLEIAHLILILVSASFVASDYASNKEMNKCMQMYNKGTRVVPVIVRKALWEYSLFRELTPLMRTGDKPILPCSSGRSIKDAVIPVIEKVQQIIEEIALNLRSQDFPQNLSDNRVLSESYSTEIELIEGINQMSGKIQVVNSAEHQENFSRWLKNSPYRKNKLQIRLKVFWELPSQFEQEKGDEYEGE